MYYLCQRRHGCQKYSNEAGSIPRILVLNYILLL